MTNFDDSKERTKDEILHLMNRQLIVFTSGSCSIVLNSIEIEIVVYVLNKKIEGFPENDYKIRWLQSSKNISVFKKDAVLGEKAILYFDYTGLLMI